MHHLPDYRPEISVPVRISLAIAADDTIYVTDVWNFRVQKFSSNGAFLASWGDNQGFPGELVLPQDIEIGPDNNIYVLDSLQSKVFVYTPDGSLLRSWGQPGAGGGGQMTSPWAMSIDGANVFVADTFNHRVKRFDLNGTLLDTWGSFGIDLGQLQNPFNIATYGGSVFVSDTYNHRVVKATYDGTVLGAFGGYGPEVSHFNAPDGIAFDGSGRPHVVDSENSVVKVYRQDPGRGAPQDVVVWDVHNGHFNYSFSEPNELPTGYIVLLLDYYTMQWQIFNGDVSPYHWLLNFRTLAQPFGVPYSHGICGHKAMYIASVYPDELYWSAPKIFTLRDGDGCPVSAVSKAAAAKSGLNITLTADNQKGAEAHFVYALDGSSNLVPIGPQGETYGLIPFTIGPEISATYSLPGAGIYHFIILALGFDGSIAYSDWVSILASSP